MSFVLPITNIDSDLRQEVGEKAYGLWLLQNQKLPIPLSFVITHEAFVDFCAYNNLESKLQSVFSTVNFFAPEQVLSALEKTRQLTIKSRLSEELAAQIFQAYDYIVHKTKTNAVSLRISLGNENYDPYTSFEPLMLNINGENSVGEALKQLWALSLSTKSLLKFKQKLHQRKIAILLHAMFDSQVSGLIHTTDPSTGDKSTFMVEAILGNGELLYKHRVLADRYLVAKKDLTVLSQNTYPQEYQLMIEHNRLIQKPIPYTLSVKNKLDKEALPKLLAFYPQITKVSVLPSTIEWSYDGERFQFFQLQHLHDYQERLIDPQIESEQKLLLPILGRGSGFQPGISHGELLELENNSKISSSDIILVDSIESAQLNKLAKAAGIICNLAADNTALKMLAKEKGIVLVGCTQQLRSKLRSGMVITLDGLTGYIYSGFLSSSDNSYSRTIKPAENASIDAFQTQFKVYINPKESHFFNQSYDNQLIDGVLYFEGEQILTAKGENPWDYVAKNGKADMGKHLLDYLQRVSAEFPSQPVFYKCSDFKTSTLHLLGRLSQPEPHDHNPTIGNRGMSRHLQNPQILELEIASLAKVYSNFSQLNVVVPYFRTVAELQFFTRIWQIAFPDRNQPKIWLSLNTPANIINTPQYEEFDIAGYVVDWTNLCKLCTGLDNQNPKINTYLDFYDPAVLWLLKRLSDYSGKQQRQIFVARLPEPVDEQALKILLSHHIDGITVSWENYLSSKLSVAKLEKESK